MLRIAITTAALTLALTSARASAGPDPLGPIWQAHGVTLARVACEPGDVDEEYCRAIALRDPGGTRILGTGYMHVRLLWRRRGRGAAPDVLVFGDNGGSGGSGDLIAVTTGAKPIVTKYSSERLDTVRPNPRTDELRLNLPFGIGYFNGAPHSGETDVPIPTRWLNGVIYPDLRALARPDISKQELSFRELAMREELRGWADVYYPTPRLYPPNARSATPVTVQALADLMLSGRAGEARAMLARAWPATWERTDVKLGGEQDFWKNMCRSIVRNPLWTRFHLDRIRHADVIVSGAK